MELEQLQFMRTHKCFFAEIPGTCKFDTTANCITLINIIEYIDIINRWHTLDIFR